MEQNKTGKYLKYAIGEIVLVMVGILLALQVNNWNESRKERILETKLLSDMVENLEENIKTLESTLERNRVDGVSSDIIISAIENKIKYNDSLDGHFASGLNLSSDGAILSNVGYESLKNVGFEIIKNNSLKKEIIRLFEHTYDKMQSRNDRIAQMYPMITELKHKRLLRKPGFKYSPFDFKELVEDEEFFSWLQSVKENRGWVSTKIIDSLEQTKKVLKLIILYLNSAN